MQNKDVLGFFKRRLVVITLLFYTKNVKLSKI